jgi:hypothetical protein
MKKKNFFGSVPKSPTQMGSLRAKNASKTISCLGTFKRVFAAYTSLSLPYGGVGMRIVTLSRLKYGASCLNNFDQGSCDVGQYYKYRRKDQQRWAGRGAGD